MHQVTFQATVTPLTNGTYIISMEPKVDVPESSSKEDFKFIADLATAYVHIGEEDNVFEYIGAQLSALLPHSFITMSAFDEEAKTLTLRYINGLPSVLNDAISILGKEPIGMSFVPHDEALHVLRAAGFSKIQGGLYELTFQQLPELMCKTLETIVGVKEIFTMGFARKGALFGNAVIITTKKTPPLNIRLIETFINLSSIALQRKLSEQAMRQSLHEKSMLIKEVHHRVKNNLQLIHSLLTLQAEQFDDEKLHRAFSDSRNRIQSMAIIHEHLYASPNLSYINTAEYVGSLCGFLKEFYTGKNIEIRYDVEEISVDVDMGIPLGMLINELVANALEHAFPRDSRNAVIQIELKSVAESDKVRLSISDNGVGLPEHISLHQNSNLGLELVAMFARQLRAKSNIVRQHGTTFQFEFSKAKRFTELA